MNAQDNAATPILSLPTTQRRPQNNRRFLPRLVRPFRVQCEDNGFDGVDISFAGMLCATDTPLWPGNVADVRIELPGGHEVMEAKARVVELVQHRERIGMRMKFEGMCQERRYALASWMAEQSSVVASS